MNEHLLIEAVSPAVDGGRYPAKCIAGETVTLSADIFRDGHEVIRAQVRWRRADGPSDAWEINSLSPQGNDRWAANIVPEAPGDHLFAIDAWTDVFGTWLEDVGKKVAVGLEVSSELLQGLELVDVARQRTSNDSGALQALWDALNSALPEDALAMVQAPVVHTLMDRSVPHHDLRSSDNYRLIVDRPRARFGAWYEMFPRSQGRQTVRASTLREAANRLSDIRDMGFDVVYLPPVHPIGKTFRKGPNNSLHAGERDPGCPWAIGSLAGGHTAIDPELGTLDDFAAFVQAARDQKLEVAMDFAIQCSPDHPWVCEHPEWFCHLLDGTIKHAENSPKKYEDVYMVNFDTYDKASLWNALRDVLLFWIEYGVIIFRADNPHTKPFAFWEWVLGEIRAQHPEVIFLSEAFTRPKPMKALAKLGFTQSYTYFIWRTHAAEIRDYVNELAYSGMQHFFRPNFFTNTPDILPEILQTGGRPAFKLRAVLAATLSPTYGIYSGFELCENAAVPGKEEYSDSEKYEIRVRDWHAPGNIRHFMTKINRSVSRTPPCNTSKTLRFSFLTMIRFWRTVNAAVTTS
jgi:starch synthase (maltosyl-transferring)